MKILILTLYSFTFFLSCIGDTSESVSERSSSSKNNADKNLLETVVVTSELSSLELLVGFIDENTTEQTLLSELLASSGQYTVFAPSNTAFDRVLDLDSDGSFGGNDIGILVSTLGSATNAANALYTVVANHVVSGKVLSTDLSNNLEVDTLAGNYSSDSNFGLLVELLDFEVTIRPSYSPTQAMVVLKDVEATNGVAHVINSILIDDATATGLGLSPDFDSNQTLLERVVNTSELSSLETVVLFIDQNTSQGTKLSTILNNNSSNYTVFAPSNDAFDKTLDLNSDGVFTTADVTLLISNVFAGDTVATADALYLVVANHVIANKVVQKDFTSSLGLDTAAGGYSSTSNYGLLVERQSLSTTVTPSYTLTKADITYVDIFATNGVAHIVNSVLIDDATAAALGLAND